VVFPGNEADIYRYWDDKGVRKVRNDRNGKCGENVQKER
jgi:hypothetical protein